VGEAVVETGQRFPVLVVGVEIGADPVDVFVARVEVLGPVLRDRRRASRQRAPEHRDRRLRQAVDLAAQGGQPGIRKAGVDLGPLAAAVQDDVDAAQGEPVPARLVGGVAQRPSAVVGGVDVEAAVRLSQRPDVGGHLLRPEQHVEPDQVFVAVALRDRPRVDQLVPVGGVGGGDVQHRARSRLLPAFDRLGEVRAPGAEALDQRRVFVQRRAELAEIGGVPGVADAEEDPLPPWQQRAGLGARRSDQAERGQDEDRRGDSGSRQGHPSLIRLARALSLPAGGPEIGGVG